MWLHYIRRAFTLPPHIAAAKAWRIFLRWYRQRVLWIKQRFCPSFRTLSSSSRLVQCFDSFEFTLSLSELHALHLATAKSLENQFNLLGSEWVRVEHGIECAGTEGHRYPSGPMLETDPRGHWLKGRINRPNLAGANKRWRLIQGNYRAVDWQLDFKTGYRWSERTWGQSTQVAPRPGVDIKAPWELGRLQHLPQLALAHAAATRNTDGSTLATPETYAMAFQNQLLDFLATNPPGWGVNWHCSMDVAIRISNVLLAWNIFRVSGMAFPDEFESVLHAAATEHGEHIANHLEWAEFGRGNHYLCNLIGLIVSASYLPADKRTDRWLTYGYWGLLREVERQFHEDGGNFEASIGYHRLSSEAVAVATAVILGLPEDRKSRMLSLPHRALRPLPGAAESIDGVSVIDPFPDWYKERLAGMARFSRGTLRPDGRIPQFGDNDNGRILKLNTMIISDEPGASEDVLDHSDLASDIEALFEAPDNSVSQSNFKPNAALLQGLARDSRLGPIAKSVENVSSSFASFPNFGVFVWHRERIWLALRCGPNGQDGLGGHAHNDQLSIEFCVDDLPFVIDPGTYLYTADPEWRNRFRSTGVHNTLAVDNLEQSDWFPAARGLFLLADQAHATPLWYDENSFLGEHFGFEVPHRRSVTISDTVCQFTDTCDTTAGKTIGLTLHPDVEIQASTKSSGVLLRRGSTTVEFSCDGHEISTVEVWWSPGYGQKIKTRRVSIYTNATQLDWTLSVL